MALFEKGGKRVQQKAKFGTKVGLRTKAARSSARKAARDLCQKRTNRVDVVIGEPEADAEADADAETEAESEAEAEPESEPVPVPKLSEREGMGLLKLDQETIRAYVIVAFATRFQEPAEEDWKSIIAILISEGVPMDARTIRQIFKNCQAGNTSAKQKSGAGRKRILQPENEGLAAAAVALNNGISPALATDICNQHNERTQGEDYEPVCRNTLMGAIDEYNVPI
jgi:hypothetical protein